MIIARFKQKLHALSLHIFHFLDFFVELGDVVLEKLHHFQRHFAEKYAVILTRKLALPFSGTQVCSAFLRTLSDLLGGFDSSSS